MHRQRLRHPLFFPLSILQRYILASSICYLKFLNESLSNGNKQIGALDFVYALIVIPSVILYFLCLAAGEVLLPFFRRGIDPGIMPGDRIQGRKD